MANREDQIRWDMRYSQGAYSTRRHPSAFLAKELPSIFSVPVRAGSRALDVACGAGRNTLYLASKGFAVTAVDISQVAIAAAQILTRNANATEAVTWYCRDLEHGLPAELGIGEAKCERFELIVLIRFVALDLIPSLLGLLTPNGYFVCEEHLQNDDADIVGPQNPSFRVAPGELPRVCRHNGYRVVRAFEGLVEEPDGRRAALSRIVVRRLVEVGP